MATRKTDYINNFWKAIAHDPALLKRTWEDLKAIMAPGAIDPLTKELLYIAVSVTNNCHYCIASHTASAFAKGMTPEMFKELQAVIGMANETNKLVTGYQVAVDARFQPPLDVNKKESSPPVRGRAYAFLPPSTVRTPSSADELPKMDAATYDIATLPHHVACAAKQSGTHWAANCGEGHRSI